MAISKYREIIRVEVALIPEDNIEVERLHFIWMFPHKSGTLNYYVEHKIFKKNAKDIRNCIGKLPAKIIQNQKNGNFDLTYLDELYNLAIAGYGLYKNLTDSYKDFIGASKKTIKILSRLDPSKYRIEFTNCSAKIDIPWGLIYDTAPKIMDIKSGFINISFFPDFWCYKFLVSTLSNNFKVSKDEPIKASNFNLMSVFDADILKRCKNNLTHEEINIFNFLNDHFKEVSFYFEEFQDKLYKITKDFLCGLVYLFGHTNGKQVLMKRKRNNDYDIIGASDIKDFISSVPVQEDDQYFIWFLNGCDTALKSEYYDFSDLASYKAFSGFIGTETILPDIFALRFGLTFLYYFLLKGKSIENIFAQLYRDHWPLSLIYTINCHPTICVEPFKNTIPSKSCKLFEKRIKYNFCSNKVC